MPVISELVSNRRPGYGLEHAFYVDPQIFDVDLERIYRQHSLLVGPVCRVARPSDIASFAKGQFSLWTIKSPMKKFFVISG